MSSSMLLSEFALKTLGRCPANMIDFSLVERAQLYRLLLPEPEVR
jgi:hypothetical protein